MNKINNYEDLILERRRLESDLAHYKSIIISELDEIKHKVEPITDVGFVLYALQKSCRQ